MLETAGFPVPRAALIDQGALKNGAYLHSIKHLKFPLVVKPLNEQRGQGVLCNLQTHDEVNLALTQTLTSYEAAIVEEFHGKLNSYRVLIFNQRILGVILRHPAHVVGDGRHTVEELVELTNKERKTINEFLGPIILDQEADICLKEQALSRNYIPRIGEKVALGYTSNATRGGTYETVHEKICKKNRKLMIRAANTLGLKLVGFDVQCVDLINTPIEYPFGVIIEANEIPSIRIHEIPMYGPPNPVTRKIMRYFIYKHPFAYLCSLYFNKQTAFYLRSVIVAVILAIGYILFSKGAL
jgi:D-alanine-D-alanine ligase-like ATP-grasp enzyme